MQTRSIATNSSKESQCIYCGDQANTRDHVPPRSLLERPYPDNLHTVPSCSKCNHGFSLDEQYFLVLLAQISTSPTLQSKLDVGGSINRALERAPALDERVISSLEVDKENGRILIQPEFERICRIIKKIALGLYIIHYNRLPLLASLTSIDAFPYNILDQRPSPYFIATYTGKFRKKRWSQIQPGIFSYIFVQEPKNSNSLWCIMDFHQTLWGVVHCPNPRTVKTKSNQQFWLFPELAE